MVGAGDLRHIAIIEQRGLQRTPLCRQRLDGRSAQRGDPVQSRRAQRLLDPGVGQHAAVAHHHHALQVEVLPELVDLCRQGHRIGDIALKHLDRDRTAVCGAEQTDHQLRPVAPVIAAVAVTGQLTAASLQIGGRDVVEQQSAVRQMTAGQRGLDEALL